MSQQQPAMSETNGKAAAALLAGAIGAFGMGLIVLAHELGVFKSPALYEPAGAVSGRTTFAVVVWLIAWAALHRAWRARQMDFGKVSVASLILIGLGLLMALPPVWHLLGG